MDAQQLKAVVDVLERIATHLEAIDGRLEAACDEYGRIKIR